MIPNLDQYGNQTTNVRWIKTPADTELAECDSLTVNFASRKYPVWKCIEAYCRITDKGGYPIPFRLNRAQIATYKLWDAQYRELGYVRCNEGKGRQMGSSTFIHAFGWTWMVTHPGFHIGILADTEEKGKGLLQKYKFFYANAPKALRDELKKCESVNSATCLAFDFGNGIISSVEVIVANENAGASKTFQMLHCSEVALWDSIGPTLTALERTVGAVKDTFIFRETTARGPNEWKGYYEAGKNRKGRFRSIFLAWWLHEDYVAKYDGHVLNEYERMLRDMGVDLDHIQWWYQEYHDCKEDLFYMKQEFPSTEAEMWQSTSVNIFNSMFTEIRKGETEGVWVKKGNFEYTDPTYETSEVGSAISLQDPSWIPDEMGAVTVFEEPKAGHPYAMACDPAKGGEDFYAVVVVDCSNDKQVATFHKRKVDADVVAFQCYCLWLYFKQGGLQGNMDNRVYVTCERNSTTYWMHMMDRLGAGPISVDRQDDENAGYVNHLGWRTTESNRQNMIDSFKVVFRETEGRIVTDYETLCEMESFQYKKSGINQKEKPQAIGGAHDDLVMAYCGYFHCKNRGDFECNVKSPMAAGQKKAFNPFASGISRESNGHFQEW